MQCKCGAEPTWRQEDKLRYLRCPNCTRVKVPFSAVWEFIELVYGGGY